MPVIIVAGVMVILTLLYIHFTKYNDDWIEKQIAGPEPALIFGNVEDAVLKRKHIGVVFKNLYDAFPEEKVVGIFVMRNPELLVKDLDVVNNVLVNNFDVLDDRAVEFGKVGLRDDKPIANNNTSRMIPSDLSSLTNSEKLQDMMHHIIEWGDAFVQHVDQVTRISKEQDVLSLVKKFTQATVAACVFGVNFDNFNKGYETNLGMKPKSLTLSFGRMLEMMYPGISRKLKNILPRRTSNYLFNQPQTNDELPTEKDFANFFLKIRKEEHISRSRSDTHRLNISDEVIAEQVYNFYKVGYKHTTSVLSFLLYQLALNQHIQDKVIAEIKETLEKHNGEISVQAISDLSYTGQVLAETLRMYPVIPDLRKKCYNSYKIPGTNLWIEKDQWIRISVLGIHNDEKIYPKPEIFDPDRFSPENKVTRHACSYLPFGLGPRQCTGIQFTQVLIRVCLVKLLSEYRVEPLENTPKKIDYDPTCSVLYPKGGCVIKFVIRSASH